MVLSNVFVFVFVDRKYTKETRGQKVSNRVLFVESLFFYQSWSLFFLFFCWSEVHERNKRPKGFKQSVVCGEFIFLPILITFFSLCSFIKWYLYSMVTKLLRLWLFPRYKRVKMGQTPEICNLYFKSDFHNFFFRFLWKFPTCSFVYQIWPNSWGFQNKRD
jgi:hypothetical protein